MTEGFSIIIKSENVKTDKLPVVELDTKTHHLSVRKFLF